MKIKSYKELDVWKKGLDIVDKVYQLAQKFPGEEKYGLMSQL
jgi:four helix bundle protein